MEDGMKERITEGFKPFSVFCLSVFISMVLTIFVMTGVVNPYIIVVFVIFLLWMCCRGSKKVSQDSDEDGDEDSGSNGTDENEIESEGTDSSPLSESSDETPEMANDEEVRTFGLKEYHGSENLEVEEPEDDLVSSQSPYGPANLFGFLMKDRGKVEKGVVFEICHVAEEVLKKQPNLIMVNDVPESGVCVVGDLHGQDFDLLHILNNHGIEEGKSYVFLGDYVDRGKHSLRVILLLFSFMLVMNRTPRVVTLLRGNHETKVMAGNKSRYHCFLSECEEVYGEQDGKEVFDSFIKAFRCLPIAAVVGKKYFCVHAFISPIFKRLEEINLVDRFKENLSDFDLDEKKKKDVEFYKKHHALLDMLWSDVLQEQDEDDNFGIDEYCEVEEEEKPVKVFNNLLFGIDIKESIRGLDTGFRCGEKVSQDFLEENDLELIIRSHELAPAFSGGKYYHKEKVLTIFSASNYRAYMSRHPLGTTGNQGSVAVVKPDGELEVFSYLVPMADDEYLTHENKENEEVEVELEEDV